MFPPCKIHLRLWNHRSTKLLIRIPWLFFVRCIIFIVIDEIVARSWVHLTLMRRIGAERVLVVRSLITLWIPIFTLITPLGGYLRASDKICREFHKRFVSPLDSLFIQQIIRLQYTSSTLLSFSFFCSNQTRWLSHGEALRIYAQKSQRFSSRTSRNRRRNHAILRRNASGTQSAVAAESGVLFLSV